MANNETVQKGIVSAVATAAYVAAVAALMMNGDRLFGTRVNGLLAPVAFLLLFVVSAAVTGMLVLGRPAMMYVDGKKREAISLLGWTVGSLAAVTVVLLAIMVVINF